MTNYLYYNKRPYRLDMISNQVTTPVFNRNNPARFYEVNPYTDKTALQTQGNPIILPGDNTTHHHRFPHHYRISNVLQQTSHTIGGPATATLAQLAAELRLPAASGDVNTFGAAGVGMVASASQTMVEDVLAYDKVLKEYTDLKGHGARPETLKRYETKTRAAFNKMNASFNKRGQQILQKHAFKMREVRHPYTGRIVNEAIPVANNNDVRRLTTFAQAGRILGPGFIALDGYLRYDKVNTMYQANHPEWEREAFVQAAGFGAGIVAGALIVLVIGFAPVGLVIGAVAAGVAAIYADRLATHWFGGIYDNVFE